MPELLPCCPVSGMVHKFTSAAIANLVLTDNGRYCIRLNEAMNWNGAGWDNSASGGPLSVSVGCNGGTFSYNEGDCNISGGATSFECNTGGVTLNPTGAIPEQQCCGETGGNVGFILRVNAGLVKMAGLCPPCMGCTDADAGDPMAGDPAPFSAAPVRYATGELSLAAADIASDGFGVRWGHTRSFASRMSVSETGGNGFNWQVQEWPYLVMQYSGTVTAFIGPNSAVWFDKAGSDYVARFGIRMSLTLDDAASRYRLTDSNGTVTEYDSLTGMFRRRTDAAGNKVEVTALYGNGFNFTDVERTYTSGGDAVTERYQYTYETTTGDALLSSVTLSRSLNGGAFSNVSRATYTYYQDNNGSFGGEGDLRTATTQLWQGGAWTGTATTLYRYYLRLTGSSSSSSSGAGGFLPTHLLKYVVNPASYARLAADPEVSDPLTASDAIVAQYADFYYEFSSDRRVTREMVQGGSRSFSFEYFQSAFSDGYNRWKYKTVETLPDDSQNVVYTNYAGQVMLKVLQNGADQWAEFWKYGESTDDLARVILHANPSVISGYDEAYADLLHAVSGNYQYLKDYEGKLERFTYHGPSGFVASSMVQHGEMGDCFLLREYEYAPCCAAASSSSSSSSSSSGAASLCVWRRTALREYPDDGLPCGSSSSSSASGTPGGCINAGTRQIVTAWGRTFWPGTCAVQQLTTNWPVIPTEQNGSGEPTSRRDYFDIYGNNTWSMDERGFLIRRTYDIPTGAVLQVINDVDTSQVDNAPPGWETPTGGGLHLITDYQIDAQGRTIQQLGPEHTIDIDGVATLIRRAMWMVYRDDIDQTWTASGYQKVADGSFVLANPVSITITDRQGRVLEQIQAVRLSGGSSSSSSSTSSGSAIDPTTVPVYSAGKLTAADSFPQWSYVSWTTTQYTDCCFVASRRMYKLIPAYGPGVEGTNYDEIDIGYDALKRQIRSTTGGGTITRNVLDPRGLVLSTWVGTNDAGATPEDPTGGGAPGNNMVQVNSTEYDGGVAGGDGNPTTQAAYVDDGTMRVTVNIFDWRNRQVKCDGEVDLFVEYCHDNLDRQYRVQRRDTTASGNLIARSETSFDDRHQVYQTRIYGVDPATGTVGYALTDNTWRDASGNVIKSLPSGSKAFTKVVIDGAGRQTKQSIGYDLDETDYDDIFNVTGDTILQQVETTYDAASNVIQTNVRHRYHNATGTGELGTPSSTQPKARVTYAAMYSDPLGRTVATADYGTNGGTALSRPDAIPARADDCLVTSVTFDSAGRRYATTDPADRTDKFFYDAMGRELLRRLNARDVISSSSSSSSSCSSGTCGCGPSADTNVDTLTRYNADGNVQFLTAVNPSTGDQTTEFVYGSTLADSGVASSLLKVKEIYPDSEDDDDVIRFAYNRQGEVTKRTDQNGTVHEYDYDLLGRDTEDRVTTAGTGIDTAVLRISKTYEVRGMVERATSHDNPAVGSGNIINQVLFLYNAFGQITHDFQAHDGAVDTGTTPVVQYGYADGSDNTIRQQTMIYPNGRILYRNYGTTASMSDALSRVAALIDDDTTTILAAYSYLGLSTFVITDYEEPQVMLTMIGTAGGNDPDTGDIYRGFDRFTRVKDQYWLDYSTNEAVACIQHGYDRAGSRMYRADPVAIARGAGLEEQYGHDALQRLKKLNRGTLTSTNTAILASTFAQCWSLDSTGNWTVFQQDNTGDGVWDLIQTRTTNSLNEITEINNAAGPTWAISSYDRQGNMTAFPKPTDPEQALAAVYDAWNRLAIITDDTDAVQTNAYDALRRRTKNVYTSGMLRETRQQYHSTKWQVLEERVGSSVNAERQFAWGMRYIDDLLLRDRNTNNDSIDERLHALQDPNWNAPSRTSNRSSMTIPSVGPNPTGRDYLKTPYAPSRIRKQ